MADRAVPDAFANNLTGVYASQLQGGPLSLFQWVEATKEGTWKLVREINRSLERPNDERLLEAGFDRRWPALKRTLEKTLIENNTLKKLKRLPEAQRLRELA